MFVKKKPQDCKEQVRQSEQIITQAMGVRVPPRMRGNEQAAMAAKENQVPASQESYPVAPLPQSQHNPTDDRRKSQEKTLESVKITAPGTYELNLPSLFERDELIMAVKEGTYFIDLASVFKKSKKD